MRDQQSLRPRYRMHNQRPLQTGSGLSEIMEQASMRRAVVLILAGVSIASLLSPSAAADYQKLAQSYWSKDQCLSAADICRQDCKSEFNSCMASANGFSANQDCAKAHRECIYVRCDSSACFKIK